MRAVNSKWPLILIRVRVFPHSLPPTRFHAATWSFDHGCGFPATEASGWRSLSVEYGHRSHESREGGVERNAGQGRFWIRQHSTDDDQSMFSSPSPSPSPSPDNALILDTRDQDSVANKADYVELGLTCANVCRALDRGMNGKKLDEISQSVSDAIHQLTMWVKPTVRNLDG